MSTSSLAIETATCNRSQGGNRKCRKRRPMKVSRWLSVGIVVLWAGAGTLGDAQAVLAKPAAPIDPIAAILDAFRTHAVVALGEGNHGNEQGHAFRLSLVRDPRFAAAVNDIILEGAN